MAPDRRLVDQHQLEVAIRMAESSIEYVEQQLGLATLRPPAGKALLRRLSNLRRDLQHLESVLDALREAQDSEDSPPPD